MAAQGDGTTSYLRTSTPYAPVTAAYSWSMWMLAPNPAVNSSPSRHAFALTNSTGGTPNGYDVSFAWDHTSAAFWKSAYHKGNNGTYYQAQYPGTPLSGVWQHVAATYDGTTLTLYYHGVASANIAAVAPGASFGNPDLTICAYDNTTGYFDGAVAEWTFWNVCLTAAQIMALKNRRSGDERPVQRDRQLQPAQHRQPDRDGQCPDQLQHHGQHHLL